MEKVGPIQKAECQNQLSTKAQLKLKAKWMTIVNPKVPVAHVFPTVKDEYIFSKFVKTI